MLPGRDPSGGRKDRIPFRDDPDGIFPGRLGRADGPDFSGSFLKDREGPEIVMENVLDEDWRLHFGCI